MKSAPFFTFAVIFLHFWQKKQKMIANVKNERLVQKPTYSYVKGSKNDVESKK